MDRNVIYTIRKENSMWEIKNENGEYKTLEELRDEVKDEIIDELNSMDDSDALCLGNYIREKNGDNLLHENCDDEIDEVFSDWSPSDILNMDYDSGSEFFYLDYGDPVFTDDVWEDLDTDEIAEKILDGETFGENITWDMKDIITDYVEAKKYLENLNPYRIEGEELLIKFSNGEADVTDLLQYIDRLTKTDEAWRKGV